MANTQSAKKRARQTIKRTSRNQQTRSSVKTAIRAAREVIKGSGKDLENLVKAAVSKISKAANKGVLHKKTAARKISRLMAKASAGRVTPKNQK